MRSFTYGKIDLVYGNSKSRYKELELNLQINRNVFLNFYTVDWCTVQLAYTAENESHGKNICGTI